MSNTLKLILFIGSVMLIITAIILHILHLDENTFVEGLELLLGIIFVIGYIIYEIVKKKNQKDD